ncbi:MAG: (2Fe-2S)-binding protein [Candidatus Competibacteraceae bacterium]|nr:(2Fe-2S)-binding protein [Candidatus Competibacteraceae bacterium]MCB1805023.1 (2Fe-2S)-binding protein [Candidatus Competibacteraceae bacterium]MCB1812797.1 (2Fe-2S)-binding protein [Candidatus Competibacteraceae bacterium]
MAQLNINGQSYFAASPDDTPLLWVIREELGLTGTKFGCGIGVCGACTVHINGKAERSCQVNLGDVSSDAQITTIEGLDYANSHPVQQAWVEHQVPQCGYCQSGQIMQAAAFLARNPTPSEADIIAAMNGNLCRCATYSRIVAAVQRAAELRHQEV